MRPSGIVKRRTGTSPPADLSDWSPAAYLIEGHHTADGRPRYRAARIKGADRYPLVVCFGAAMWEKPGQAILEAEALMAGLPSLAKPRRIQ